MNNERRDHTELKELFNIKLEPIIELIKQHDEILHGKDGRSGIVKDINSMNIGVTIIKWVVSITGLSFIINHFKN